MTNKQPVECINKENEEVQVQAGDGIYLLWTWKAIEMTRLRFIVRWEWMHATVDIYFKKLVYEPIVKVITCVAYFLCVKPKLIHPTSH